MALMTRFGLVMGRVDVLGGRERRRFWSDEQKRQILSEAATGNLTIAELARKHDIQSGQIYAWRKIFAAPALSSDIHSGSSVPCFVPVTLVAAEPGYPNNHVADNDEKLPHLPRPAGIEIGCKGGRILKIDTNFDVAHLTLLIRLVEQA